MTSVVRRCLAMSVGALLLAAALFVVGVPGAVLLALAPMLVCAAMYLLMDHGQGDAGGRDLLETARRAARYPRT